MKTKIVSQLDAAGYFAGATVADESPLEPGVWIIPGGAIEQVPPAVISSGKRYRPSEGGWIEEDTPPETNSLPLTEPATTEELAANIRGSINRYAAAELDSLTASYPSGEVASWPQQTSEANALQSALGANGTLLEAEVKAIAPLLRAISTARSISVFDLAERVMAKVQSYAIASGQIIGKRQALEDAIDAVDLAAEDARAQLEAIKWDSA